MLTSARIVTAVLQVCGRVPEEDGGQVQGQRQGQAVQALDVAAPALWAGWNYTSLFSTYFCSLVTLCTVLSTLLLQVLIKLRNKSDFLVFQ